MPLDLRIWHLCCATDQLKWVRHISLENAQSLSESGRYTPSNAKQTQRTRQEPLNFRPLTLRPLQSLKSRLVQRNHSSQQQQLSDAMQTRNSAMAQPPPHIMPHSLPFMRANVLESDALQLPQSAFPQQPSPVQIDCPPKPSHGTGGSAWKATIANDSAVHFVAQSSESSSAPLVITSSSGRTQMPFSHDVVSGLPESGPLFVRPSANSSEQFALDASAFPPNQVVQTQSRLPPNSVARKIPRKGTFVSNPTVQSTPKDTKPRSGNAKQRRQYITSTDTSFRTQRTPKQSNAGLNSPRLSTPLSGGLKIVVKEEVDKSPTPLSPFADLKLEIKTSTSSNTPLSAALTGKRRRYHKITTPVQPQSRLQYWLTPELEGVKHAFGQQNWTEYLILAEKLMSGEIMEVEFEVQERRMFQVLTVGVRRKIRDLVLQHIERST